jgi:multiple sugar transport system substrate-binding protein
MSRLPLIALFSLSLCLLVLCGCPTEVPEDQPSTSLPSQGVKLRLVVADDPELVGAIRQLQGEWNAQTGAEFTVEAASLDQLHSKTPPVADAMIVPSGEIGSLAAAKQIVKLPENLVDQDNAAWSEIFSQVRAREAVWANQPVAVPFGSPVLVCYYRVDLLGKLGRKPPKNWQEYHQLSKLLVDRQQLGEAAPGEGAAWSGTLEPLGPGWAGQMFLARAASYATHREIESTLFQIDTMEPLIDGAPFVRALEELVADAAPGSPDQLTYDPRAVRQAFWEGKCGLAITWPSAATKGLAVKNIEAGLAELPGSMEVYNLADRAWDKRDNEEDPFVPLLAASGRMGVVSRRAQRPEVAFQLLVWLSSGTWGRQVCAASPATTLFRSSQLDTPRAWVEKPLSTANAARYAAMTERTLNREGRLLSPRIPGRSEYLAVLDMAVQKAVRGEKKPAEVLHDAAEQWRRITDRLGIQAQRQAYWQSLGLD